MLQLGAKEGASRGVLLKSKTTLALLQELVRELEAENMGITHIQ